MAELEYRKQPRPIIAIRANTFSYLGSQELTDRIAPPARRAEVFSGFQLGLYLGAAIPSLLVGFGAAAIGFYAATYTFACVILLLAVVGIGWLALTREKDVVTA